MSMSKDSELFCSQCKFSKYVEADGKRGLRCEQLYDEDDLLPVGWTYATWCPFFQAEKRQYRSRSSYKSEMFRCGISMQEEKRGLLAQVRLK